MNHLSRCTCIRVLPVATILVVAFMSHIAASESPEAVIDAQYGHKRTIITLGSQRGFIIEPSHPAANGSHPWVWYAPTFIGGLPGAPNEWLLKQLLERGFAVCGVDVGESYGNPEGRKAFSRFYDHFTKTYMLDAKVSLIPQSRGGLMLYNWAAENPEKIRCIGGIYPVCDLRSYPGIDKAAPAYRMTPQQLTEHLTEHNPMDRLALLAKAGVPILHVHGDADKVVPLETNSGAMRDRYTELGGKMEIVIAPGKGHEVVPEFFQSERLLQFLASGGRNEP